MKTVGTWALIFVLHAQAIGEEFAGAPKFPQEVEEVFFDDALKELSGEPPSESNDTPPHGESPSPDDQSKEIWKGLIDADTLTSKVKHINVILTVLVRKSQTNVIDYDEFHRELTMLAILFRVIREYPDDIRWKSSAGFMEQSCLRAAASIGKRPGRSLAAVRDTFIKLQELLRGQSIVEDEPPVENLILEFAPLMHSMKWIAEDGLPVALSNKADFHKKAVSIGEQAQLLAMLSQVIRGEEYGYADEEEYQAHADSLRDAATALNVAATERDFEKAVQAAAGIQKACNDCHADYRG